MSEGKTNKKELKGIVVSNKMQGTIRVQVDTPFRHPVYKKIINKRKIFFAHTDKEVNEGDEVTIRESRPYSKNVKWVVVEK
ncbi:MAG: 30S ribosomal protein S17 [Candidatus Dojkabacteria bacterium]|nr:30S ribosomal protein S17 [Candidatus Dojkabacteria bacterium]